MTKPDCPLCTRLSGVGQAPPGEVVWSFPHSVAFLGPWQAYHGYCVLVARVHARELADLADEPRRAYLEEMCLLARAIQDCCRPRKMNYEMLGNQVPHLHWHLFPRYETDPEHLQAVWLALDRAARDVEEKRRLETGLCGRGVTAMRIRDTLARMQAPRS